MKPKYIKNSYNTIAKKKKNLIKKMGICEETFLQRRHTDGQEAHEKMFNVTNYQRNANKNYSVISPYPSQNGHHQKKSTHTQKNLQTINAGEDVEKRDTYWTVSRNVN